MQLVRRSGASRGQLFTRETFFSIPHSLFFLLAFCEYSLVFFRGKETISLFLFLVRPRSDIFLSNSRRDSCKSLENLRDRIRDEEHEKNCHFDPDARIFTSGKNIHFEMSKNIFFRRHSKVSESRCRKWKKIHDLVIMRKSLCWNHFHFNLLFKSGSHTPKSRLNHPP